jgi:hypothetical protein
VGVLCALVDGLVQTTATTSSDSPTPSRNASTDPADARPYDVVHNVDADDEQVLK